MTEKELFTVATKAVSLYREKNKTFTFAESCTGGLLSKLVTDVSGASSVYPGGVCTYANEIKTNLLGVKEETLRQHGAVSEETAREMSVGVKKLINADVAVAVTGIAGPLSDNTEKPVGLIYLARTDEKGTTVVKLQNGFTENIRENNRLSAAEAAFNLLLEEYL